MPDEPKTILQEADEITEGARQLMYGPPKQCFDQLAVVWSIILGTTVTARQVNLCQIAMKLLRDAHHPKRDNLVDMAGYARVIEMCEEGE